MTQKHKHFQDPLVIEIVQFWEGPPVNGPAQLTASFLFFSCILSKQSNFKSFFIQHTQDKILGAGTERGERDLNSPKHFQRAGIASQIWSRGASRTPKIFLIRTHKIFLARINSSQNVSKSKKLVVQINIKVNLNY